MAIATGGIGVVVGNGDGTCFRMPKVGDDSDGGKKRRNESSLAVGYQGEA